MSGPKRTNYRLQQELRRRLAQERREREQISNRDQILQLQKRLKQLQLLSQHEKSLVLEWINEAQTVNEQMKLYSAQNRIRGISKHIDVLSQKEGKRQEVKVQLKEKINELKIYNEKIIGLKLNISWLTDRVNSWIEDAANSLNQENVFEARNGIKGIESFLSKNENKFLPAIKSQNKKLNLLNDVKRISDYENVITEQINIKIKRFSSVLEESIESNKSLSKLEKEKIESFIAQANEIKDKYDQNEEECKYVKGIITEIIDGHQPSSEAESSKITGKIGGTQVDVRFNHDNSDGGVIFTINDSSKNCSNVLQIINDKLNNNDITLGDIHIENTGQTLNLNTSQQISNIQGTRIIQR